MAADPRVDRNSVMLTRTGRSHKDQDKDKDQSHKDKDKD